MANVGFFEVRVDDFDRAQKFYRNVFGWEFSKDEGTPYEYYMIKNGEMGEMGIQQGGMRKREKPLAKDNGVSGYVCLILVDAIDEALEKIANHGGKVTSPKAHIPAGYFAYALDTEENAFGVWEVEK
ncbi:MAG: VOC family protein [Chloroflexota bacterium]|nr:VOC family protein [Chloroflexota bacterium]